MSDDWERLYERARKHIETTDISPRTARLPENQRELFQYCMIALKLASEPGEKRAEAAIELSDKALELDPQSAFAWFCKGQALSRLERRAEAFECYRKSSLIDGFSPHCWHNQGVCLQALGRIRDSVDCFKKAIFCFTKDLNLMGREETRKLYADAEILAAINALDISYRRLFYPNRSVNLLKETRHTLQDLNLNFPEKMRKHLEAAELTHESMRNISTNLEEIALPGNLGNVDKNTIHESVMLLEAFRYDEAFQVFKKSIEQFEPSSGVQVFFATQLLESVPYKNLAALDAQGTNTHVREQRITDAKRLLEEALKNIDRGYPIAGKALNNKAVAIIQFADYSRTWEDLIQKHEEAFETLKEVTQAHPYLEQTKTNLTELQFCLNSLTEKLKKEPDFVDDYIKKVGVSPEKGFYLTNLRDMELVANGGLNARFFSHL